MDQLSNISTRQTPQNEPTPGRTDEVVNNAGGYVFALTSRQRLRRFLTIGVDRPTYYCHTNQQMRDTALANAAVVFDLARDEPGLLLQEVVDISLAGRAPSNDPALFALAVLASHSLVAWRRAALSALPKVARTGAHLFTFVRYVRQHRGWGRTLRRAVGAWYAARTVEDLAGDGIRYGRVAEVGNDVAEEGDDVAEVAYQVTKYRQRDGWTHRDLLRLSHGHRHIRPLAGRGEPHAAPDYELGPDQRALFDYLAGRDADLTWPSLERVRGFEEAKQAPLEGIPAVVRAYGLTWEMLPDRAINDPATWRALLNVGVPQRALLRQLSRLSRIGVVGRGEGNVTAQVVGLLTTQDRTVGARIHPIQVLSAMRSYSSGRSFGGATWMPDPRIVDALDEMFYHSFGSVQATGLRHLLAIDTSGSMSSPSFTPGHAAFREQTNLTPAEVGAAMMMATLRAEKDAVTVSFTGHMHQHGGKMGIQQIPLSARQRLDDVIHTIRRQPQGGTDCALPMLWAAENRVPVDVFTVYTDNETWAGEVKVPEALRMYRDTMGIDAKLVVVGMTVNEFTIADPNDRRCLDVVGFDSAAPRLIADFAVGNL